MELTVTLTATITVPDGSKRAEDGSRAIILPNGDWVKPFIILELNDDEDLTFSRYTEIGCEIWEQSYDYEEQD